MRKGRRRGLSLLLVLVMLLGLLPGTAWAAGEEDGTVKVGINFDYRSVGESEVLDSLIELPSNQTVTVSVGSTVYDVLEEARTQGDFAVQYGIGYGGVENGYVVGIGGIGEIGTLCEKLGAMCPDLFKYAGWTYTVDGQDGSGIQSDTVTENCTVLFQYQVYNVVGTGGAVTNYDIPFVDAYYGLKEKLTEAEQLNKDTFSGDWDTLQNAIAQGKAVVTELQGADETGGLLENGLILNYLCQMQTSIWGGSSSPTGKLQEALQNLESVIRGEVVPKEINISGNLAELTVGQSYTITHTVLPDGASQEVTYEAIVGNSSFTVSKAGEITPIKSCNLCMIQIVSKSNPSVSKMYQFKIVDTAQPVGNETALLSNISADYVNSSSEWNVMDLAAYARLKPDGAKLSDQARQVYIDKTILGLAANPAIAECAKGVLILSSLGVDPTALTLMDGTTVNAVEKLKTCTWDPNDPYFVYTAPYVLLACQQGDWGTDALEQQVVSYLLGLQKVDGSWDTTWGYDTMGMVIQGLAAYDGKQQNVTEALDQAEEYLRDTIQKDGLYPGTETTDAGISAAEVAIGLSAIGIDPATVKKGDSGTSLKDGILSRANETNTAFVFQGKDNPGTTERCFRALIAMAGVAEEQKAYSVYDFTSIPKKAAQVSWSACPVKFTVIPSQATIVVEKDGSEVSAKAGQLYDLGAGDYTYTVTCEGYTTKTGVFTVTEAEETAHQSKTVYVSLASQGTQGGGESAKYIDVTIKVMTPPESTERKYTYKNDSALYTNMLTITMPVTIESGSTVRDVLIKALDQQKIAYKETSNGYFSSIGNWGEQIRFSTSGWLYMVGGEIPLQSADSYTLTSNQQIVWFYTDDYTKDYGSESWGGGKPEKPVEEQPAQVVTSQDGSYQVTLPKDSTGSVLVTIPKVSQGDLLVIVHADGTQEVVKKSVIQDGTAYLMLEENATVKVVDYTNDFTDVTEDAWYAGAVDFTAGRGLFSGVGDGSFAPNETLSRGMVVTVLYALEEPGAQKTEDLFSDVADGAWYAQGTAWAVEAGIVSGYGDGQFGPNDAITREQLALMLYRYAQNLKLTTSTGASLTAFGDEEQVSSWARQAMSWAVGAGIMGGTPENTLNPGGTATRAEAAVMVSQFVAWMLKGV